WKELSPVLDEALDGLSEDDRQVVLLRFFEQRTMADLGRTLGVTEDAAKMRVSRALGRLRAQLGGLGVPCSAAFLGTLLFERSIEAAPQGLTPLLATIRISAPIGLTGGLVGAWLQAPRLKLLSAVSGVLLLGSTALFLQHSTRPDGSSGIPSEPPRGVAQDVNAQAPESSAVAVAEPRRAEPQAAIPVLVDTNTLSFRGTVIDKFTHEPVQGATVHVRREIYSATEHKVLLETEHLTDAEGHFQFSLTPEQAAHRSAYLNFEVTHPAYARRPWDGYGLSMIRKNESLGERPFFEQLDLTPAENISGTLVQPDGTPAADVKVLAYSKAVKTNMSEYGSFAEALTDASGAFRVNVVKGGEAVLWLLPQQFVPSTHLLHQQRGDLGQFVLEEGIRLSGRVVDSDGLPVSNVWVNAELSGGPAKKRIDMPVADALERSALTDHEGQFATGPLPAGDYDLLISEYPRDNLAEDRTRHSVPDVFLHQKLHVDPSNTSQSIEIRAVPHLLIDIQQLDRAGNPHKAHEINVSGVAGDTAWWGEGRPDENGRVLVKAPRGLTKVRFDLLVNEHQSTRYRWSDDSVWSNDHQPTLPVLDHDINGMSVIYYTAPIVLVRAVAEDGTLIPDFKCQMTYAKDRKPHQEAPHWINGVVGEVNFEKQADGRWRSESLLPDENLQLIVEAAGFQSWSQSLNLSEGVTREVDARLRTQ
ncbi:MAG TPA: sigma factor-like helix-turn-helix DNA-binding protein, partial [Candidatus Limnocylindrales bacterium]|nr:sigma factor-like helix-turn-helix DNA-binding protein [Candidatus Limnocylindrales bacterium]